MFGADVAGDIAVRHHHTKTVEIKTFGCRHMRHLLPQRAGFDRHVVKNTGKPIDMGRSRASHIDNNRGVDFLARRQFHPFHAAIFLQNLDNIDAKAECGTMLARRIGHILR
ncbi:MAG: Uncharacterised protein [SAR116 cluster bacterium]|nr:MAG: Uncharacterised protein [SAR116 cluster bacterium]